MTTSVPSIAPPTGRPRPPRSRLVAMLLPAVVVWIGWLALMASGERWDLFTAHAEEGVPNWYMSVTMAFGSFIAGATSEGGGAVAFPVMTLGFDIAPAVARDFSLMIQSVGMIAAGVTILWTRVSVVRGCLPWTSLGGALGIVLGLEFVAPNVPPAYAKMLFTSTWLAFACALWLINRARARLTHRQLPALDWNRKAVLVLVGIIGGSVTAITGSGLDILTFSLLVLVFRVSERVATPTSVVLMGVNALIGALYQNFLGPTELSPEAWNYWWVCVPVVVVGAPLGAQFIRTRSRLFIARMLIASIAVQFVAALLIVPQSAALLGFSTLVFLLGLAIFSAMSWLGTKRSAGADMVR